MSAFLDFLAAGSALGASAAFDLPDGFLPESAAVNCSSLQTSTPIAAALSALEPAPGPAIRMSTFLVTDEATVAPAPSADLVASARFISRAPVKQMEE